MLNLDLYALGRPDRISGADRDGAAGEPLAQQLARSEKRCGRRRSGLEFEEAAVLRDWVRELKECVHRKPVGVCLALPHRSLVLPALPADGVKEA